MSNIEIRKADVSLQFCNAKDIGSTYKVEFYVNINLGKRLEDQSVKLTMRNVDSISLKKAIMSNLTNKDSDYMDLVSFDTTKAVFHLKTDKWIKEATKGVDGVKNITTFSIVFKLKEPAPSMIKKDILSKDWENFVSRKFKQWVSDKPKRENTMLNVIFTKEVSSKINQKLTNMFDFSYDPRWNKVEAKLKSIWVVSLMVATTKLSKYNNVSVRPTKEKYFAQAVGKEIDRRSKKDYSDLIDKKYRFKK